MRALTQLVTHTVQPVTAMYKILLLTDFSAASRHAIAYTQALFADTAADFCLVNAFPIEPEVGFSGAFLLVEQREQAEKSLRALLHEITRPAIPTHHSYRTVVIPGSPETCVDVLLHREHFDLVVAGATGSGRNERFGSVATGVVRTAKTNVLVVPSLFPIRPLERVVLATDYRSINDAESLTILNDIASRKNARLTLLTVAKPDQAKPSAASSAYVQQVFPNLETDTYIIHDDEVLQGINTYLDAHMVDLLVMVPHHKGLLDVVRNSSVTRSVVYHPRVPVLALYDSAAGIPAATVMNNSSFPAYLN